MVVTITSAQKLFETTQFPVGFVVAGGLRVTLGKQIMCSKVKLTHCYCLRTDHATLREVINDLLKIKSNNVHAPAVKCRGGVKNLQPAKS